MRILAFSDVAEWEGYEELVNKVKPDIITLTGDLTSDGSAHFWWFDKFEETAEFRKLSSWYKKPIIQKEIRNGQVFMSYSREKYLKSKDFLKLKTIHVDRFYQFLKYASKKSNVLVIKGNHDEDFKGDYIPERINSIRGCREISGKTIDIKGIRFLGLGFDEARCLRNLKVRTLMTEKFRGKIDVVVMHGENIRLVSLLKPKLIIKGGGGFPPGKVLVNDVPSVFTDVGNCAVIEFKDKTISEISQYVFDFDRENRQITLRKLHTPFKYSFFKRYKWVKPLFQLN